LFSSRYLYFPLLLDVIVGSNCSKHPGNIKFSQFISAYKKARSRTNPQIDPAEAVKEIVTFWRNLSPPGRFLAKNKHTNDGLWVELETKLAMKIASFFLMKQISSSSEDKRRSKSGEGIAAMRRSISSHSNQERLQQMSGRNQLSGSLPSAGLQPISGNSTSVPILQMQAQSRIGQIQGAMQSTGSMQVQGRMNNTQGSNVQVKFQGMMVQGQQQQGIPGNSEQLQRQVSAPSQLQNSGRCMSAQQQVMMQQQMVQGQSQNRGLKMPMSAPPMTDLPRQHLAPAQLQQNDNQRLSTKQQFQDFTASLEPNPIGPVNLMSMGQPSMRFDSQKQLEPVTSQSYGEPMKDHSASKMTDDFGDLDFDPLPLDKDYDFDPLPADLGMFPAQNADTNNKVHVSVNMVVNHAPQGFQKDSSVNTVTNIQIGTGSGGCDDRSQNCNSLNDSFSKPFSDAFPASSNFQLSVSAQSNHPNCASRANGTQYGMNDFQMNFFEGSDEVVGYHDNSGFKDNTQQGSTQSMQMNSMQAWQLRKSQNQGNPATSNNQGSMQTMQMNSMNSRDQQKELNKSKVGNSVPCASDLADLFDDW